MNTDLTTAAVERLTAQLGEALFNQPGLNLIEIANRCNAESALAGGALLGSTAYPVAWSWVGRDHSTHFTEEADTAAEAQRLGKVVRPLYGHASALPKPAKPEAVRLRDELRERAEFEAWARQQTWIKDCQRYEGRDYGHYETQKAWATWQAALAATGKQQVGEVQRDSLSLAECITDHLCQHEYDIGGRAELLACVTEAIGADARKRFEVWARANDHKLTRAEDGEYCFISVRKLWTEWQSALAARQPVGQVPMEMRICELRHVSLKPNRPYVFTVDANCANCRADAAYAMGHTDTSPTQAVDLGQFREAVAYAARSTYFATHREIGDDLRKLLALIDGRAVQS